MRNPYTLSFFIYLAVKVGKEAAAHKGYIKTNKDCRRPIIGI